MAKDLKKSLEIQKQKVQLTKNRQSVDGDEVQFLETQIQATADLHKLGGRAPTLRDINGNVVLYSTDESANRQIQRTDQYITVELIKPDFDDVQAKLVLDTKINELYTPRDDSEISRLKNELELLRKQLRDSSITITPTPEISDEPVIDDNQRFPATAILLPDKPAGILSTTPLTMALNTGIFYDENMVLDDIGSGNPFSVNWWIIDHNTNDIYEQGVSETLAIDIKANDIHKDKDLDVILELTQTPSNFSGWFVNDQSTGKLENYHKFSNDAIVRFRFIPRFITGVQALDENRNNYYIIPSFLNEAPNLVELDVKINITSGNSANVDEHNIGALGAYNPVKLHFKEVGSNDKVYQERDINTSVSVTAYKNNTIILTAPRSTGGDRNIFDGWYEKKSSALTYDRISQKLTLSKKLDGNSVNLAVGYITEGDTGGGDDELPPVKDGYPIK